MKKRISGYITLEASFIIPLTIMVLIMVIYFTFYLYNQCVVYQDCFLASLRGSQIIDAEETFVQRKVYEEAKSLLENQVYEYSNNPTVEVSLLQVKVDAKSNIRIIEFLNKFYKEKILNTDKEASALRLNPAKIIRALH